MTSLEASSCTALTTLECYGNQLTSLDVSKNTALTTLNCYKNRINGEAMTKLVNSLPDRTGKSSGEFRVMDSGSDEKNQCSPSDISIVQDKNWNPLWSGGDPYIAPGESVSTMMTSKAVGEKINLAIKANGNVTIEGVGETPQLDGQSHSYTLTSQTITIRGHVASLDCRHNRLTSLDVSGCTYLTELDCSNNPLTSINLSGCQSLKEFSWRRGNLTSLNVSGCTALTELDCEDNRLTSLDVSGCTALTTLDCYKNQLTSLDVSGCTALTTLDCYKNQLTSLNVSKNTALTSVFAVTLKRFVWRMS